MSGLCERAVMGGLLFVGFFLLFVWIGRQSMLEKLMTRTKQQIDESLRQRLLDNRRHLAEGNVSDTLWNRLEACIYYSGMKVRFHALSAELLVLLNLCVAAALFILGSLLWGMKGACLSLLVFFPGEFLVFQLLRARTNSMVDADLPKFLDFLGNYSMTTGEITSVFAQIAVYMHEPLRTVLEECCHEAGFTGDAGTALLSMREKIEHPQFKEIVSNLEINLRYCADFSTLVQGSRRSLRDYMKTSEERKGMLQEAVLNMVLLLIMSFVALLVVNGLIPDSIWDILLHTLPGRAACSIVAVIICLFAGQVYGRRG